MFAKIMFIYPGQQLTKITGELLNGAAVYSKQNALAAACIPIAETALRKAGAVARKIPVPVAVKKNVSRQDVAFIAAAYAIPLPGTALFAAILVGIKLGCRHLRTRLSPGLTVNISNG